MIYVLALIALVVVVVLLWKSFGPEADEPRGRVTGPDDDPDFMWKIDRDRSARERGATRDGGKGPERPDAETPGGTD
ncbi:MAG: hypothetical protein WBF79_07760 [Rhodococcus sp. (in: high G+C Gram-positive bacteria)]